MLKLYIVRHGKTLFNQKHLIQGWCDAPLTSEGLKQAQALNKGLANIHFDACYSSTSERAMTTAKEIIKGRNIPFHTTENLKEFNFGSLEGDSEEKLVQVYPVLFGQEVEDFDGDTLEQLTNRLLTALEDIYHHYPDGNVLVVTHGGAITALLKKISILEAEDLISVEKQSADVDNCSVTILERNFGWKILETNNTQYLKDGLQQ